MEWLTPWFSIANDSAQMVELEQELHRELAVGHPLYGLPVRALGRRQDCDDVLFALEDGTGRVAVVHLTWTHSPPERLPWPCAEVFSSIEAWEKEDMCPQTEAFHAE